MHVRADLTSPKLTTFGDCRLEDRHRRSKWDDFIAIHPRSPPAPAFPQLHLENERQLRKAGYINVTKQLTVDAGMLEPYSWLSPPNAYRLTAESFAIVAARFNIEIINPTLEQRQLITETKFRMLEPKRRTLKHLGGADQAHPVPPVRYCEPPRPDTSDSLDKQSTKQTTRKGFVTLLWQILVSLLFLTVSYVRPHLLRIILSIGVTISVAIVRATWTLLRGAVGMMNFIVGADFLIFG